MNKLSVGAFFIPLAAVFMTAEPGWGGDKLLEKGLLKTPPLPAAVEVRLPADEMLERLQDMVVAYMLPRGYGPITIELNRLGTLVANEKLPDDAARYAWDIFAKVGVQTFPTLPEATTSKSPSGVVLDKFLRDHDIPPKPMFRLEGGIENAEPVVVQERNGRVDTQFGGGHTSANGGANKMNGRMLTALTVSLRLVTSNGVAVPGANARYRAFIEETTNDKGVEFYLGGNGFGIGSRLKITRDSSDAIYSTMASAVAKVLGNALKIPYSQCDTSFQYDAALENRVRQDFGRFTDLQLQQQLQRYMIVSGSTIGRQWPLNDSDRMQLMVELRHRNLLVNRAGMLELAMEFWRGLDYREGARRMAGIYMENDLQAGQRAEQESIQQASLSVDPTEFGFAPGTSIIVIDLSRIGRPDVLKQVSATLQRCSGCGEVRFHQQKPLVGINTALKEADIQHLISSTRFPFEYVWSHVQSPRVLVVPVAGSPPQVAGVTIR